jgi:hypothetical protein
MRAFLLPLAGVAGILLVAGAAGWVAARAVLPGGREWRAERAGWALALGCLLIGTSVAVSFVGSGDYGWLPFLVLAAGVVALALLFPVRASERAPSPPPEESSGAAARALLRVVLLAGVAIYALQALTEPMWSNDFVAIWGFKGKTFFASGEIPDRLFRWQSLGFSHPEYPLGLPLLYAGIAFLLGRWDDHAMALVFPFWQVATLLLLAGWLRRQGASRTLALTAAALLAHFEPLYSAFLTGMAEVPLAFGMLLLATAFCDNISGAPGALRRLVVASALLAATKNEGLLIVLVACVLTVAGAGKGKAAARRAAAALLLPALAVLLVHRVGRERLPLRDFHLGLLAPAGWAELLPRVGETLRAAAGEVLRNGWAGLLALSVLILAGRRSLCGERLLLLAGVCAAAYLFVPALAVAGPAWLVQTALARTLAALGPLLAAAVAVRLADDVPASWPPVPEP